MKQRPQTAPPLPNADGTIGVEAAAEWIGVSAGRVSQLVKLGWITKTANGRYLLGNVVKGFIAFLRDEQRLASRTEAAAELTRQKAAALALRTAKEAGELCDVADALGTVDEIVGKLRADLAGLPARLTRDLEMRRRLDSEIDAIFGEASVRYEREAERLRGEA
jgi:hypothetical protein